MCYNPVYTRRPDGSPAVYGCGHCLQCLKQYQDQWTARLNEELKCWHPVLQDGKMIKPVVFFTLKYADRAIPTQYLCMSYRGVWIQSERPSCSIIEMHTDLVEQRSGRWPARRKANLEEYAKWYNFFATHRWDEAELLDGSSLRDALDPVMWHYFEGSNVPHPVFRGTLQVVPAGDDALVAFEFHTVRKQDFQAVMKRFRQRLTRAGVDVRTRFASSWTDYEGQEHPYPSCAVPTSAAGVKYFLTSEYGPVTQRPHMHGVMFGVTYDEFERYFASDWMACYGDPSCPERAVDFSLLRESGGAMMYLSKYCSKGGYDHPYCARDFFYPAESGNIGEYHSKYYEQCIADFGVNIPLVQPTFHLISKGIGACYAFQSEIQEYFGVQLAGYLTDSDTLKYSCTDADDSLVSREHLGLSVSECVLMDQDGVPFSSNVEVIPVGSDFVVRKFDGNGFLIGESVVYHDAIENAALEALLLTRKYNRTYVTYKDPSGKQLPGKCLPCWHKIGIIRFASPETKQTSISLPRYYRQWLVSPLVSALRSAAARLQHTDCLQAVAGILRSDRSQNQKMEAVRRLMVDNEIRREAAYTRLRNSADRFFYAKSGIKEVD